MELLRSHPAILARLFDIKQECIWKYLLMGESQPFGPITDYWRRVEVLFCFSYFCFFCFYNMFLSIYLPNFFFFYS